MKMAYYWAIMKQHMNADAQCYECGKVSGIRLCEGCVTNLLQEQAAPAARGSFKPFLHSLLEQGVISAGLARRHLNEVYALTPYSRIDAWINRVKRHSDRSAMGALGQLFELGASRLLARWPPPNGCLIIPIPCSLASLSQRGFSIADKFAMQFCQQANRREMAGRYRMDRHLLQLRSDHWYPNHAQKTKDRKARLQSDNPFILAKTGICGHKRLLPHQQILLIDDIATTGQTLGQAAQTLHAAYPELPISALVLGFTERKPH